MTSDAIAVQLLGRGTTLQGGSVHGGDLVIAVVGEGSHLVQDLHVSSSGSAGVGLVSDSNVVRRLIITLDVASVGIEVTGGHNLIRAVTVTRADLGFGLAGTGDVVLQSRVERCDVGVDVPGDGNFVALTTIGAAGTPFFVGIQVEGEGNWLIRNTAPGGDVGGLDIHGDCAHNRWLGNDFTTAEPACILGQAQVVAR